MQYRKAFLCLVPSANGLSKVWHYIFYHLVRLSISIVGGNNLWLVMVQEDPLVSAKDSRNLFGTVCSKPVSEQFLACLGIAWQAVIASLWNIFRMKFIQWHTKKSEAISKQNNFFITTYNLFFNLLHIILHSYTNTNILTLYGLGLLLSISFFLLLYL